MLVDWGAGYAVAGVNTFVEGYGGHFGDLGGGVVLEPYLNWISEITGLVVPEPSASCLLLVGLVLALTSRSGKRG